MLEICSQFIWIDRGYNIRFWRFWPRQELSGVLHWLQGYGKRYKRCVRHNCTSWRICSRLKKRLVAAEADETPQACDLLILDEVGNAMLDRQRGNKLFTVADGFLSEDFHHCNL
jgi:hypothetical protein